MMTKPINLAMCSILFLLVCGASSFPVLAGVESEISADPNHQNSESAVKDWLELQSSGQAASAQAQPLSGPVMERVQERYLKSFSHPVPPFFEHVQPINK